MDPPSNSTLQVHQQKPIVFLNIRLPLIPRSETLALTMAIAIVIVIVIAIVIATI
jgi:hypothetical protein